MERISPIAMAYLFSALCSNLSFANAAIVNGSFEQGLTGWHLGGGGDRIGGTVAAGDDHRGYLTNAAPGIPAPGPACLWQEDVTIPEGAEQLEFLWRGTGSVSIGKGSSYYDREQFREESFLLPQLCAPEAPLWPGSLDVREYAGESVDLVIETDAVEPEVFGFDDFHFHIPPPRPPRTFGLIIGVDDQEYATRRRRGDLDAGFVYFLLSMRPGWASASYGNPTAPLIFEKYDTNGEFAKQQIEEALDEMRVRSGDTIAFYFAGHGGHMYGEPNDVDERPINGNVQDESAMVTQEWELSDDYLTGLFNTSKWNGVKKVFMLDSCFSGGFENGQDSRSFGDLDQLDDYCLLAAATEEGFTFYNDISGQGYWTTMVLAPWILAGFETFSSFDIWMNEMRDELESTLGGMMLPISSETYPEPGSLMEFSYDPYASASPDFMRDEPLFVPEPATLLLLAVGGLTLLRRDPR